MDAAEQAHFVKGKAFQGNGSPFWEIRWQPLAVADFTAQNRNVPYLGCMQPLRKEDLFTGPDLRIVENHPTMLPVESTFDPLRGLLMGGAYSGLFWAVVLICWQFLV